MNELNYIRSQLIRLNHRCFASKKFQLAIFKKLKHQDLLVLTANILDNKANSIVFEEILAEALEYGSIQGIVRQSLLAFVLQDNLFVSFCWQIIEGYYKKEFDSLEEKQKSNIADMITAIIGRTTEMGFLQTVFIKMLELMPEQDWQDVMLKLIRELPEQFDSILVFIFKRNFPIVLKKFDYQTHKDFILEMLNDVQTVEERNVFKKSLESMILEDFIMRGEKGIVPALFLDSTKENKPIYLSDNKRNIVLSPSTNVNTMFGVLKVSNSTGNAQLLNDSDRLDIKAC